MKNKPGFFLAGPFLAVCLSVCLSVLISFPCWAQDNSSNYHKRASIMARAPGIPENSLFSNLSEAEKVNEYNGNLLVQHPSTPLFPLDGGGSFGLTRVWNEKTEREESIVLRFDPACTPSSASGLTLGDGWSGWGWTHHLGRMYQKNNHPACGANVDACGYSTMVYELDEWAYVDSQGTEYLIKTLDLTTPHPRFRFRFYHTSETACKGEDSGIKCITSPDNTNYFEVTYPDGRRIRLERVVPDKLGNDFPSSYNYHINYDRSGFYATKITDPHGNEVQIEYWGEEDNPEYPEAIKEIRTTHANGITVRIWSVVYSQGSNKGRLKELHWLDSNGNDVFSEYLYSDDGHLEEVKLPRRSGYASAGSFRYEWLGEYLQRIEYPTGGVSKYSYGIFTLGEHDQCYGAGLIEDSCCTPVLGVTPCVGYCDISESCNCMNKATRWRKTIGVEGRWVFPEGDGEGKPFAQWSWNRFLGTTSSDNHNLNGPLRNQFQAVQPDGRVTESKFWGPLPTYTGEVGMDDPRIGSPKETAFMEKVDGNLVPYRKDQFAYTVFPEPPQVTDTQTTYFDDKANCFSSDPPGTEQKMWSRRRDMDGWKNFRMEVQEGDYLPDRRVIYRNNEDEQHVQTDGTERIDRHVLGAYDYSFVEEGGKRQETELVWDGKGEEILRRNKAVWAQTANAGVELNNFSVAPLLGDNNPGDVESDSTFNERGNLTQVKDWTTAAFAGAPTGPEFISNYTWQFGQAALMQLTGISWNPADVDLNSLGQVVKSRDPNVLETIFEYDSLGRLTRIAPPGVVDTKITYPDLKTMRVSRSNVVADPSQPTGPPPDPNETWMELRFDGLGRVVERRKKLPGVAEAVQVTRYDGNGREIFLSEWMTQSDYDDTAHWVTWGDSISGNTLYYVKVPVTADQKPWGRTTFYGVPSSAAPENPLQATPDPLGRVRKIVEADGASRSIEYCGPHRQETIHGVKTGPNPEDVQDVVTRFYFNGAGRLVLVDGPPEGADAAYRYDPLGNLTEVRLVDQLPANPFQAWKSNAITGGQVRRFEYDALGRLLWEDIPERGRGESGEKDREIKAYSAWDHPLVWTEEEIGSHYRSRVDAAGRVLETVRVRGTAQNPETGAVDRLNGQGGFEGGLGSWVEGTIDSNGVFQSGETPWRVADYNPQNCLTAPPEGGGNKGLTFGGSCSYAQVPAGPQAARISASGVGREDLLRFKQWRQVRQSSTPGSGDRDKLEIWVVLQSQQNQTSARRVLFSESESQASFAQWIAPPALRPGDFFNEADWPKGQTRDLYLYVVFEKGDLEDPGLGSGVIVDNLTLGTPELSTDATLGAASVEKLVETVYDEPLCQPSENAALCSVGELSANYPKGKPTTIRSYRDGRLLSQRQLVYKGYEGRLSGVQEAMDWTGVRLSSGYDRFIHHWRFTDKGLVAGWTAPYLPGAEEVFSYQNQYVREYWKGVKEDKILPAIFVSDATYGAAGEPLQLTFQSDSAAVVQQFSRDIRHRPSQITFQRAGQNLWNTGAYQYDGAGNITGIGGQKFYYDKVGRLAHAEILPQARSPWVTVPDVVDYAYDLFGNMTSRDMTQGNPPAGLEFTHQFDRNRIIDAGFGYDDSGNLMRLTGKLGASQPVGALWDHQNRMTAFVEGELYSALAKPAERYQYDATGHRLVRVGRDGVPVISLRDSEGRTLAEYLAKPGEALPHLNRNFIYGQGQLLVERVMADAPLKLMGNQPPTGSTNIPLTVVEGAGAPTYAVDVRTAAGPVSHLTGVTLDANNRFLLDQTNLAPGETNWVRIKAEGDEGAVYSRAVRVVLNPDAVPGGENQIRAVSLSRSGTDLVVRWGLAAENGKKTRIYFKRSDNGAVTLLTQVALNAGVRNFTLAAQGLSSPCGEFHLGQVGSDDVESPLTPALFFAGIDFGIGHEGGCIDDPPTTPEPPKWADYYHVRDHLGTLRLVTDISGYVQEAHDYEPFGLELVPPGQSPGTLTTRKFTGHERDASTGLDYMMARYYPASLARFLSVDPLQKLKLAGFRPQMWNRFSYTANNPLNYWDPRGKELVLVGPEEQQKKALMDLKNTVPADIRMFIRTTTTADGKTIIDQRYLRMAGNVSSGNFQTIRAIANNSNQVLFNSSQTSVKTASGVETLGANSATAGLTVPKKGSLSGNMEIYVGGDLNAREAAETTAEELRHAARNLRGEPWKHEKTTTVKETATGLDVNIGFDPKGPVNIDINKAVQEAGENYDPFVPQM